MLVAVSPATWAALVYGLTADAVRSFAFAALVVGNLAMIPATRSRDQTILAALGSANAALWWITAGILAALGVVLSVPPVAGVFRSSPRYRSFNSPWRRRPASWASCGTRPTSSGGPAKRPELFLWSEWSLREMAGHEQSDSRDLGPLEPGASTPPPLTTLHEKHWALAQQADPIADRAPAAGWTTQVDRV